MNKKKMILFIFIMLNAVSVWSATFYQLQGGVRSIPQSASVEAHFIYNEKLWSGVEGESPWKYGFWRLGAFAAAHGQGGVKVEVFPISIWQIQLQKSATSRFYDTKNIDCAVIECRGVVQRGSFKTSFAIGYQNYFLVPSYTVTDLTINSGTKDFSSEEDNIIAENSGDQLVTTQVALGLKLEDQKWILVSKDSRMVNSRESNSSQYLIWSQTRDKNFNYFIGGGSYKSTHLKPSLSLVLGVSWTEGENLSFF